MSDTSLRDAASAELKQVTAGWLKANGQPRYPNGPSPETHWAKAMASLSQISPANATPRNAAVTALKKTTKGYSANGKYWNLAFVELAKIADAPPPAVKPSIPTGLTATPGDKKVTLNWNASPASQAVDVYQVYLNGANLDLNVPGASYVAAGLVNGQSYGFRVSAHNAQGYGDWTAEIAATPAGAPPPPPPPPPPGVIYPNTNLYPSEVSP